MRAVLYRRFTPYTACADYLGGANIKLTDTMRDNDCYRLWWRLMLLHAREFEPLKSKYSEIVLKNRPEFLSLRHYLKYMKMHYYLLLEP